MTEKTLLARVYLPSGLFLQTWEVASFRGFTKQLNGGCSECVIQCAVPFDYDGADLREGNQVDLVISDGDTVAAIEEDGTFNTRLIYRGYISLIERDMDGSSETVTAHLLGFYTLLSIDVLKSSAQTTLYSKPTVGLTTTQGDLAAADIGLMARTVSQHIYVHNPNDGGRQQTDASREKAAHRRSSPSLV